MSLVPKSPLIDVWQWLVSRVSVGNYWCHVLRPSVTEQLKQHLELKTILSDMDTPPKQIDWTIEQVQDTFDASKRTRILQWLSAEPYQKHPKQARSDFVSGTGAWLLADPVYKRWKDESASSILWLHGIPGSGKSILVSAVIEDTLKSSQMGQSPLPVYFYCSRNPTEPNGSMPSELIASITRQLARFAIREGTSKTVEGLVQRGRHSVQFIEELLLFAATNYQDGTNVIPLLLSRLKPRLQMSTSFLREIISTFKHSRCPDGQRAVRILKAIQSDNPEDFKASICGSVLQVATEGDGPETLEFLLQLGIDHAYVTPAVIKRAVLNKHHAKVLMVMVFASHGDHNVMSEDIMIAACKNGHQGINLVKMMMTQFKDPLLATGNIIIAIYRGQWHSQAEDLLL
ncbi:hypothetical protein BJX62DRAFT_242423 [Aspergillus germanicus]